MIRLELNTLYPEKRNLEKLIVTGVDVMNNSVHIGTIKKVTSEIHLYGKKTYIVDIEFFQKSKPGGKNISLESLIEIAKNGMDPIKEDKV